MKYFKFVLPIFLISLTAKAQQLYRGIVVDSATFSALPSVNITVKNTLRGTSTDAKGAFSINAKPTDTLIFTLVGYKRFELPLFDYEAGLIPMSEQPTLLAPIDIYNSKIYENPYEGMFDDERTRLRKKIPFYYSKARKDKVKAARWREDAMMVQTYVDVVINNPKTKEDLMKDFSLTEKEYYDVLTQFNEQHYQVMYFLTAAELTSLLNKFFEAHAPVK